MASQATLDKAAALKKVVTDAENKRAQLQSIANPTDAQKREIRALNNQISQAQYQFRVDKDLLGLAGENMSPADKLAVYGLGVGTVGGTQTPAAAAKLLEIAAAEKAVNATPPTKSESAADSAKPIEETRTEAQTDRITFGPPLPNVLHNYPSWTYGISLHLLTAQEYNMIVKEQKYTPERVLIASAGRYNNDKNDVNRFPRSPYFNEDFYFDGLEIETVIGMNEHSRATNAIKLNFNIIEPYGLTLLNRIIRACADLKVENYLAMPYLLQIDFFGIDNNGEKIGIISEQTKRIPIQLIKMDIKASNKGSEYQIHAVPFNHSAYDIATVSTPLGLEVTAGSLESFFTSTQIETFIPEKFKERETLVKNVKLGKATQLPNGEITYIAPSLLSEKYELNPDSTYTVKSYSGGLNSWMQYLLTTNKVTAVDTYKFKIHPDLLKNDGGKFVLDGKISAKNLAMQGITSRGTFAGDTRADSARFDTRLFTINRGTSIDAVINHAMRYTKYIQDQLVLPELFNKPQDYYAAKRKNQNLPLMWYKIVPTVELGDFDKVTQRWSRTITYHILPMPIYNAKLSMVPQGQVKEPVKRYKYFYTGQNDDIIEFNIEFNVLYYNEVTAHKNSMSFTASLPADESNRDTNPTGYSAFFDANDELKPNAAFPIAEIPVAQNSRAQSANDVATAKEIAASDVEYSIYTASQADMLNCTVKIIGDPQYIKQDDVFYPPEMSPAVNSVSNQSKIDPRLVANGSLRTDDRELYVEVQFLNPVDIDESTGHMKYEKGYLNSAFSGIFRVLTVNNMFRDGKFEQVLNLVRLPRQPETVGNTAKKTDNRQETQGSTGSKPVDTTPANTEDKTPQPGATSTDDKAPGNNPVQDNPPPAVSQEQQELNTVRETAPVQTIDAATQPPQLGNDATDAQLAQNYRQKAAYFQNLADNARASGNASLAEAYEEQVPVYQGYAERRQALADGRSNQ